MLSKCQTSTDGYGYYTPNSAEPSRHPCQRGYKWQCTLFSCGDQIPDKRQLKSYFCLQLMKRLKEGLAGHVSAVRKRINAQEVRLAHKTSKLSPQFLRQSFTSQRIQNLTKQHHQLEANCPNRRLRATFHSNSQCDPVCGWFQTSVIFLSFTCFHFLCNYSAWPSLLAFTLIFPLLQFKTFLKPFFLIPTNKQHPNRFSVAPLLVHLEGFELSPWKVL